MTGLGIVITVIALAIVLIRIAAEVKRGRITNKGGILVGLAFIISFIAIVSVALVISQESLGIRLSVLGFCVALVFSSYKLARRRVPTKIIE
ncbi:MAG TPA: hypothetical protein VHT73_05260 [Thermodesulfobacteriota bacterium]|nr:hypothetical protein [Thermodesulfobacteriota bacterium]